MIDVYVNNEGRASVTGSFLDDILRIAAFYQERDEEILGVTGRESSDARRNARLYKIGVVSGGRLFHTKVKVALIGGEVYEYGREEDIPEAREERLEDRRSLEAQRSQHIIRAYRRRW